MYQPLFREFFMGEMQVDGGGFGVLPALLTIKVDIALSQRYSRQPQASNRKLMTRLCMWHCSCAKLFPWQKSCQILSGISLMHANDVHVPRILWKRIFYHGNEIYHK